MSETPPNTMSDPVETVTARDAQLAFERGDFARVKQLARRMKQGSADQQEAESIRARLRTDRATIAAGLFGLVFFALVALFYLGR